VDNPVDDGRLVVDDGGDVRVAGMPRYRLVEPRKQTLTVLKQVGGAYREAAVLTAADALRTDDPFPLVLPVGDIF
jgi:hypothetical protein